MSGRVLYLLFAVFALTYTADLGNEKRCDDLRSNFSMKSIIGTWYVVAVIPKKAFQSHEYVACYKVEFSETDVAGLKWLANATLNRPRDEVLNRINGTIVRQRYHSDPPFDVWSKYLDGVNGCFQEVFTMDQYGARNNTKDFGAMMQIHLFEKSNDPFLLQILWGKMISVVIYSKRQQGITSTQLKQISDVISSLRGPHLKPKMCIRSVKDVLQSKSHSINQTIIY